jgi:putative membrane-bound dehydrogenase-like protein
MPRSLLAALFLFVIASAAGAAYAPIPPERAAERMTLPEGFHVALVAGEPQLVKPIAMTTDDRGRLWVVESHSYPNWITDGKPGQDRVLIFEDKGKGKYESKVFLDHGTNLSGIALGFGGVWLCASPDLLFIPIDAAKDAPAGPPRVVLDGWSLKAKHNVFNSLTWGPDGWLYGCNGILDTSYVGKPGTPKDKRIPFNCGVWRYHPVRETFEPFAWGTTNPWGLDFDDRGEAFVTNCVIEHVFHFVPGGHYKRMYGQDLDAHVYGLMQTCADHIHWAGGDWTKSRGGIGAHDAAGGGHAHAGALIYLGDSWPDSYRGHIFMCNIHGSRVNQDYFERKGSGYVAKHGKDFLMAHDEEFRGLVLQPAADGSVFVADWHDTGECHNYDQKQPWGRVFKVTYGEPKPAEVDLTKLSDDDLVKLQLHKDEWHVRHARRILQERAHDGKLGAAVKPALRKMLDEQKDVTRQLRAIWALYAIGGLGEKELLALLDHPQEDVRGWAVRLLVDGGKASEAATKKFAEMAKAEKSPSVRLALASALQRLTKDQRLLVALQLAQHPEDATDPNIPLMVWYGIEPLVADDAKEGGYLLVYCRIPIVRQYIARRLAEMGEKALGEDVHWMYVCELISRIGPQADEPINRNLAASGAEIERDILRGMYEALQGRPGLSAPKDWMELRKDLEKSKLSEVREKARLLSVLFGDKEAIAALRTTAGDAKADEAARRTALQTLVEAKAADLSLLRDLIGDKALRGPALRALAGFNDPAIPALVLKHYSEFGDAEKADAVSTLASRPAYALALLDAMEQGKVQRRDLSAFAARQLLALNDKALTEKLTKVWGSVRKPQDKSAQMNRYLSVVPPDALKKADRAHGRQVFAKTCATCHTLFGEGAKIGPDLTGSQRVNPEYVLSKVLDPSAVVAQDYQVTAVTTKGGRTLTGLVKEEDDKTLVLQTQNEQIRVAKADIDERKKSPVSMMPEGLLMPLSDVELRDLMAYLTGAEQVPLPK